MAISLLFGVLVSTLLTLVVIPLGCISAGAHALAGVDPDSCLDCYVESEKVKQQAASAPHKAPLMLRMWAKTIEIIMMAFYIIRAMWMMAMMGLQALWAKFTKPKAPAPIPPAAPSPPPPPAAPIKPTPPPAPPVAPVNETSVASAAPETDLPPPPSPVARTIRPTTGNRGTRGIRLDDQNND